MGSAREPSLTVVVPTLDEAELLPRLLARLTEGGEGARDRPDELLVVDGGSRDGTPALARAAGARVAGTEPGRGRQLGAGARLARSEVLVFLHADSLPAEGAIAAVRRAFADPRLVAAGMSQVVEGERRVYRWIERASDARVRRGTVYGDSGLCVRRIELQGVGGFGDLPIFEEADLCRRLASRGRIALLPDARLAVSPRRWEADGVVLRTARNWLLTLLWLSGVEPHRLARHYAGESGRERARLAGPGAVEPEARGADAT